MAELCIVRRKLDEAEPLYSEAAAIREKILGLDHPVVIATLKGYANLLHQLDRPQDAVFTEARVNAAVRQELAKRMTDGMILKQSISLSEDERKEVERQVAMRIKHPGKAKGPIEISRPTLVSRGSASSPISDGKLKKDVQPIRAALGLVKALNGVRFNWKTDEDKGLDLEELPRLGFIAQDVERVIPDLVYFTPEGYRGVHYANLVAILVEAIKEQQLQIERLSDELLKN